MFLKKFLDNIHHVKEKVPTVERKCLLLVLPQLGVISLQTRTKLKQGLKGVENLNCWKLEIDFKCHIKLSYSFGFKDLISKDLWSRLQVSVWSLKSSLLWREYQTIRYKILLKYCHDIYKTQEMCNKAVSEDPFMLKSCHDRFKTNKADDDFPSAIKFVPDWFVTSKITKKVQC